MLELPCGVGRDILDMELSIEMCRLQRQEMQRRLEGGMEQEAAGYAAASVPLVASAGPAAAAGAEMRRLSPPPPSPSEPTPDLRLSSEARHIWAWLSQMLDAAGATAQSQPMLRSAVMAVLQELDDMRETVALCQGQLQGCACGTAAAHTPTHAPQETAPRSPHAVPTVSDKMASRYIEMTQQGLNEARQKLLQTEAENMHAASALRGWSRKHEEILRKAPPAPAEGGRGAEGDATPRRSHRRHHQSHGHRPQEEHRHSRHTRETRSETATPQRSRERGSRTERSRSRRSASTSPSRSPSYDRRRGESRERRSAHRDERGGRGERGERSERGERGGSKAGRERRSAGGVAEGDLHGRLSGMDRDSQRAALLRMQEQLKELHDMKARQGKKGDRDVRETVEERDVRVTVVTQSVDDAASTRAGSLSVPPNDTHARRVARIDTGNSGSRYPSVDSPYTAPSTRSQSGAGSSRRKNSHRVTMSDDGGTG